MLYSECCLSWLKVIEPLGELPGHCFVSGAHLCDTSSKHLEGLDFLHVGFITLLSLYNFMFLNGLSSVIDFFCSWIICLTFWFAERIISLIWWLCSLLRIQCLEHICSASVGWVIGLKILLEWGINLFLLFTDRLGHGRVLLGIRTHKAFTLLHLLLLFAIMVFCQTVDRCLRRKGSARFSRHLWRLGEEISIHVLWSYQQRITTLISSERYIARLILRTLFDDLIGTFSLLSEVCIQFNLFNTSDLPLLHLRIDFENHVSRHIILMVHHLVFFDSFICGMWSTSFNSVQFIIDFNAFTCLLKNVI